MTYRIEGLSIEPFRPLFTLDEASLKAMGARRMAANAPNSAPCRVSLVDAAPRETLVLVNHRHLDAAHSPYRSEGPIFVREAASDAQPLIDAVPDMLVRRLLSVRVYDADAMMQDADVVDGAHLAGRLTVWFDDPRTHEVHIHTARRGCYLARAVRN